MTKKISYVLLFCFLFQVLSVSNVFARDDWQYWHRYNLSVKLHEKFKLKVNARQELHDDFSESRAAEVATGFLWKPISFLETGPFYKYGRSKNSRSVHVNENRFYFDASLKMNPLGFRLSDRNRIEYRSRNGNSDLWRYRNRIKISYPIPIQEIKLEPFAAEELFFSSRGRSYDQNRVSLGFTTHFTDQISLSLYYLLKSNRRSGGAWSHNHVLNTSVGISI